MATSAWCVLAVLVATSTACQQSNATSSVDGAEPDAQPPAPMLGTFGLCGSGWNDTPFAVGVGNPFAVTGCAAGDAAVIQVGCVASSAPTSVAVTSPGWTITPIGRITGSVESGIWAASFGTIVPAAEEAWFSVQWDGVQCESTWQVGDDLRDADPSGSSNTFDSHAEAIGLGAVSAAITTGHANDIVWFAGASRPGGAVNYQPGYSYGMSDGNYDWTFYKYTSDPAGSLETVGFRGGGSNSTVVTAVTVHTQ